MPVSSSCTRLPAAKINDTRPPALLPCAVDTLQWEDRPLEELLEELDPDAETRLAFCGTHRCCAERRLLQWYEQAARRAGVPPHKSVAWVRRKMGGTILVWRRTADGRLGCAAPCLFCARELRRYDIRVCCSVGDGDGGPAAAWFSGRLSEDGAPAPCLTGGQKAVLRRQGWQLCNAPAAGEARVAQKQQQQRQQPERRRQQQQQQQQQEPHQRLPPQQQRRQQAVAQQHRQGQHRRPHRNG